MHWEAEAYMPYKETWDFRGKVGNSQVALKEQTWGKHVFAGSSKNSGAQRETGFARFFQSASSVLIPMR